MSSRDIVPIVFGPVKKCTFCGSWSSGVERMVAEIFVSLLEAQAKER